MRRKQIDHYKLGEMLGVGTVGTVYEAVDQNTGQRVALKLLQQAVSEDKNIAARFRREMDILSRLNHPNIVRYLGDGKLGKQLYYTMELVTGGSVKEELQIHRQLPWRKVCDWGAQIASALQHAHNHGIIHRDLKPANLFLTDDGKLKLGDFGIARDTGSADLTDAGLTVGTYAYMAPEQITAEDPVSDKTDLYALGCLLFEMLTGRQPYLGANFAQIFNQHLQGAAPRVRSLVPECPASLDAMIRDLMEKDPEQRPFNAR
ncbi:MAG: serine/threonine-protein kinase, partial [Pirellulales bacterium]